MKKHLRFFSTPLSTILTLLAFCSQAAAQTPRELPVVIPEDFVGMCHTGFSGQLDREYTLLNEMKVVWVHRDFSWRHIEPANDAWNFDDSDKYVARANQEGKKILGMLLYDVDWIHAGKKRKRPYIGPDELPHFCDYARETVKRYNGKNGHGKVDAWCIWNEPNMPDRFWRGTKDEFFTLTKETAKTIRELDREQQTHTTLVGGVLNTIVMYDQEWVTGLFESGAMDQVDAVSFHPYSPSPLQTAFVFNWFKQQVAPFGFADKIWVNEMGYPNTPTKIYFTEIAEEEMPDAVAKTFVLLASEGARTLHWYHLFDSANRNPRNPEDWFGLIWKKGTDWQKKGGFHSYVLCSHHLPGKTLTADRFPGVPTSDDVQTFHFQEKGGTDGSTRHVLIIWNDNEKTDHEITVELPGTNRKRWDTATGQAEVLAEETYTGTAYRPGDTKSSILFFTWDEP